MICFASYTNSIQISGYFGQPNCGIYFASNYKGTYHSYMKMALLLYVLLQLLQVHISNDAFFSTGRN